MVCAVVMRMVRCNEMKISLLQKGALVIAMAEDLPGIHVHKFVKAVKLLGIGKISGDIQGFDGQKAFDGDGLVDPMVKILFHALTSHRV